MKHENKNTWVIFVMVILINQILFDVLLRTRNICVLFRLPFVVDNMHSTEDVFPCHNRFCDMFCEMYER